MELNYPILNTIGNTPLIDIKKLNPNPSVRLLAKLESFNPGGSIKDRIAAQMIKDGIKSGKLTKDKIVIEATSGNTGIGLALVCSIMDFRLLLAMSEAVSEERRNILKARGADILLTPEHLGTDGAIEEVYRIARENPDKYFMTDQFNNPSNMDAHYFGTAEEIWKQTNGEITSIVATMGTTGTLMGLSKRLKEYNSDIKIIGVEPYLGHKLQGLKNMKESYQPELYEKGRLDKKVNIEDEEAFEMTRRLAKEEGLFMGMSSGAAMAIACHEASAITEGTIVVILPDGGERYLSTQVFIEKEKSELQLFNTVGREKKSFEPIQRGKVSMYSCGPTVNERMHLGLCRSLVFADLLHCYLKYRGFEVNHIININDLDDKIITGSEEEGLELSKFTEQYIDYFKEDLRILNIKSASDYPKVSEHLEDMINLAKKLEEKGFAYEKLHSLYFDISRFTEYGKLSGTDLNKIKLGATVELENYEKDNPRDFTLLKRSKLSELKRGIYIKTKWGNVRPSLHIQCAAISMKYLGECFDIHTSGQEMIFPHNENELAIAKAVTGESLAKYWIHCDPVYTKDKKSKKKKGKLTLEDLKYMGYSNREIRYWLLSSHYRKSLKFSAERLADTRKILKRPDAFIRALKDVKEGKSFAELDQLLYDLKHGFIQAMNDDLNISMAMAHIFKIIKKVNILIDSKKIDPEGASKVVEMFRHIDSVLKIFNFEDESRVFDDQVSRLIIKRDQARKEKNFKQADKIRHKLKDLGIKIQDDKLT